MPVDVGPTDSLPADERWIYPRYLGFRPADGQICQLNPPVQSTPGLAEIWDGLPRVHNNLWVTTTPRTEARFLAIIVPWQQGAERPHVSKRELDVVEVTCDRKTDVISFNPQYTQASIAIDIEGIRNSAVFDRQQLTEIARHL